MSYNLSVSPAAGRAAPRDALGARLRPDSAGTAVRAADLATFAALPSPFVRYGGGGEELVALARGQAPPAKPPTPSPYVARSISDSTLPHSTHVEHSISTKHHPSMAGDVRGVVAKPAPDPRSVSYRIPVYCNRRSA